MIRGVVFSFLRSKSKGKNNKTLVEPEDMRVETCVLFPVWNPEKQ